MSEPLATMEDLTDVMSRPLTENQQARALRMLGRASGLLRVKAPWIDDRIADGSLDPDVVGTVVAQMVKRVMLNPSGGISVTTGPYAVAFQGSRNGVGNDGALKVTDDDLAALTTSQTPGPPRSIRLKAALAPGVGYQHGRLVESGLAGYPDGLSGVPGVDD